MTPRGIEGAILVLGAIILLGGPILWWIFHRMDERPTFPSAPDEPPRAMDSADIARIEQALGVVLPPDYAAFVQRRDRDGVDATSVWDDAGLVIEQTREYRAGGYGAPPWPSSLVCIGDEDDASPRVLDCSTGACLRLDKGRFDQPFGRHATFRHYLDSTVAD